jgi:hypothetical protein
VAACLGGGPQDPVSHLQVHGNSFPIIGHSARADRHDYP